MTIKFLTVETHKTGKYGRWLADILYKTQATTDIPNGAIEDHYINLNKLLLEKNHAKKYN